MRIRTGDRVAVLSGDDRGKRGNVLRCNPGEGKVVVEGVNVVFRHVRRSQKYPRGGRIQKEAPVPVGRVGLLCPKCDRPRRVGVKVLEDGKRVRVCRKCGAEIPPPGRG